MGGRLSVSGRGEGSGSIWGSAEVLETNGVDGSSLLGLGFPLSSPVPGSGAKLTRLILRAAASPCWAELLDVGDSHFFSSKHDSPALFSVPK